MRRKLSGYHVLAMVLGAFGLIVAVNLVMAYQALSTFPGLEVANSYVASQSFERRRDAQEALGWHLEHAYLPGEQRLVVSLKDAHGQPAPLQEIGALIGRPSVARADQSIGFAPLGPGDWASDLRLEPGRWLMRLHAVSLEGARFEQRVEFYVGG